MAELQERLAAARAAIEQTCQLLLTPFPLELDECSTLLSQAIAAVSKERAHLQTQPGNALTLADLRELQWKIRKTRQLLETAARHYHGWELVLRSLAGGYTSQGEAAPMVPAGRVAVHG
ncbi:MAG TPA: hypothetical protein VML19_32475 [Verrucomicrobiae bacterium]|nr:hypothetical protein [Verrucomicrobiae bacterium]